MLRFVGTREAERPGVNRGSSVTGTRVLWNGGGGPGGDLEDGHAQGREEPGGARPCQDEQMTSGRAFQRREQHQRLTVCDSVMPGTQEE